MKKSSDIHKNHKTKQMSKQKEQTSATQKGSLKSHIRKLCFSGIMSAISVVLILPSFKIFMGAPFLEYNPSDIPIIISSMCLGPIWGSLIAIAVSAIQALTISASSGMYGFLMHVSATCVFAIVTGVIFSPSCRKRKEIFSSSKSAVLRVWISLVVGGIASVLIMIPMNMIFVPIYMPGVTDVGPMITSAIIPFNLLKMVLNCTATGILFIATKPVLNKIHTV